MVQEGVGTAQEMLEAAEKKVYSLRKENSGDSLQHIGKVLINVYDRLEELAESGNEIPGLSTGLHDLDKKINGLNKSDLLLIAARPGMGKTSMALNVALSVAKSTNKTVAFFSLEMSREQLAMRLLSNESFVDNQKLVTGKLTEEGLEQALHRLVRAQPDGHPCGRQPGNHGCRNERKMPPARQSWAGAD